MYITYFVVEVWIILVGNHNVIIHSLFCFAGCVWRIIKLPLPAYFIFHDQLKVVRIPTDWYVLHLFASLYGSISENSALI